MFLDGPSFVDYWRKVRARTIRVFERIPADDLEWTHLPGKYTFGDVFRHLPGIERYMYGDKELGYVGVIEQDETLKVPDDRQLGFEPLDVQPSAKDKRHFWRTFSFGYWIAGLGERSGPVRNAVKAVQKASLAKRPLTMTLGDERVVVARKP